MTGKYLLFDRTRMERRMGEILMSICRFYMLISFKFPFRMLSLLDSCNCRVRMKLIKNFQWCFSFFLALSQNIENIIAIYARMFICTHIYIWFGTHLVFTDVPQIYCLIWPLISKISFFKSNSSIWAICSVEVLFCCLCHVLFPRFLA